jgi:4-amino-4-deoxy-L-arabinose transferase-like glycosyltransferase
MRKETTQSAFLHDLLWIVPAGLAVAALLSALDGGTWWIGWLAYSLVGILGLSAVAALWRSEQNRSGGYFWKLGLILLLAIFLRLGLGVALSYILPVYSHASKVELAGYIYMDAYTRDTQAWQLASSTHSLLQAFDKSFSTDQYGGMLFVSSTLYRLFSPDVHRPWLIILLGALTAAAGVALAYKAACLAWGESMGRAVAWILALYPEAVLLGSSQMREPFLMTFLAMTFWGVVDWQVRKSRQGWWWIASGVAGMLLFHPGTAAFMLLVLAGWYWLAQENLRLRWWLWVGAAAAVLVALGIFAWAVRGSVTMANNPLEILIGWLQQSAHWDLYLLDRQSGWVQEILKRIPARADILFVVGYGVSQPVLPAALADTGPWSLQAIGILRSLGWYALLPFLVYSLRPIWKGLEKKERRLWLWLWGTSWIWIILSAVRAGADQWDNPRYRVYFLLFQAGLAVHAWKWGTQQHDRWLGRVLAVEGVFLVIFTLWYLSRYTTWIHLPVLDFFVIVGLIVAISAAILVGGWAWDRFRPKPK